MIVTRLELGGEAPDLNALPQILGYGIGLIKPSEFGKSNGQIKGKIIIAGESLPEVHAHGQG